MVVLAAYGLAGNLLALNFNDQMVYRYPTHMAFGLWFAFAVLVPLFWYLLVVAYRVHYRVLDTLTSVGWDDPWRRWLFIYPLVSCGLALLTGFAATGWMAGATLVFGEQRQGIAGTIVTVEPFRPAAGCDQRGEIELLGSADGICLEGYSVTLPAGPNQSVTVGGLESSFGFLIKQMGPR